MATHNVAAGQIWREQATGQMFLVTRIYSQLFDDYAVLRRVGSEETSRVKLQPSHSNGPLPGFAHQAAGALD